MKRGLKLAPQLLVLVTIPILVQLALLFWLAQLQKQSELESDRAVHATLVSRSMQKLQKDLTAFAAENIGERPLRKQRISDFEFNQQLDSIHRDYSELDQLLSDDPQFLSTLRDSRAATDQACNMFREVRASYERAPETEVKHRKKIFDRLRGFADEILSDRLLNFGHEFEDLANQEPQIQQKMRERTSAAVLTGLGMNFLLLGALALFIIVRIAGRLKTMTQNTHLFAAGKPLLKEVGGTDELGELDSSFHSMATALEQSMHRERVIVENALDMIITLDSHGRIKTANRACETMLGVASADLLGTYIVELIESSDVVRAQDFLDGLRGEQNETTIQLRIKWKNQPEFYTLWSARYDPSEQSIFCVIHDINERMQAEQLRQEVVAMVSHDLRSPLTTIQNAFEMMEEGFLGTLNERGMKVATATQISVQRMLDLVNDLLDIEKIKSGMMPCEFEEVDVNAVMQDAVTPQKEWALGRGVTIQCETLHATITGDHKKLVRVISNLLGNALKFSPNDSVVKLSARLTSDGVEISVADQGEGIPTDMLTSIFDRYRQVPGSSKGGSGLGLTICKSFVELHHGKIWAESVVGKGSAFKFLIPTKQPPINKA